VAETDILMIYKNPGKVRNVARRCLGKRSKESKLLPIGAPDPLQRRAGKTPKTHTKVGLVFRPKENL